MNEKDFSELIEEIGKAKSQNTLVIVEGKKDRISLENLGFKNIFPLKENRKGIQECLEQISEKNKEVIVLTDLDTEGKKLYSIIKNNFSHNRVRINDRIRNLLLKLKVSHVEGLDSFISNCECKGSCPKSS